MSKSSMGIRAGLQVGSSIPFFGGLLAAAAGVWSEIEQQKLNKFFQNWLEMLDNELREKSQTIEEVAMRLDLQDEKIQNRMVSPEYDSIIKKSFRSWSSIDTEDKRVLIRNILVNSASCELCDDDVVRMFIDWITTLSSLHIKVISVIYNHDGYTRKDIWNALGKKQVPENTAEADLFKLVIRDLSQGGVIRQHRITNMRGEFIKKERTRHNVFAPTSKVMVSAFDDVEGYELTSLGNQFVHYAMTDIPPKITYQSV